ncbi:uncharacterized protein LOC100373893 [Saccoglossus kowalevskii]
MNICYTMMILHMVICSMIVVVEYASCTVDVHRINELQSNLGIPHGRVRRQTCSAGWSDVAGVCVIYGDTPKNWWMAHLDCIERGGYLASKDNWDTPLEAVVCPSGSNHNADETYCYELTNTKGTLQDAEEYCQSKGGTVPDVTSYEEIQFILAQVTTQNIPNPSSWSNGLWIGQNKDSSATWVYLSDGETPAYTDWASEQPDGADEQLCAVIIYDSTSLSGHYGKMHDTSCDNSEHTIMCKYNAGAWVGALWVGSGIQCFDGISPSPTWVAGAPQSDQCALELKYGTWNTADCSTLRLYVCREGKTADLTDSVVNAIIPSVSQDNIACPVDNPPAGSFYNPDTHMCYWFTADASRESTLAMCTASHNASLAVIDDELEGEFIFTKMLQNKPSVDRVAIGIHYSSVSTEWVTVDGISLTYTHWENNIIPSGSEECAYIGKAEYGRWIQFICVLPFPGVCEFEVVLPTTVAPTIADTVDTSFSRTTLPIDATSTTKDTELALETIRHTLVTSSGSVDQKTVSGLLTEVLTLLQDPLEQLSSTAITYLVDIVMALARMSSTSEDIFEKLLWLCDFVLLENNQEALLNDISDETFAEILELTDTLSSLATSELMNEDVFTKDNLDVHIFRDINPNGQDYYIEVKGSEYSSSIILPKEIFGQSKGTLGVLVVKTLYVTSSKRAFVDDLTSEKFNSLMYSVSFTRDDGEKSEFGEDVITFYFQNVENPTESQRCAFWDPDISEWSVVGCYLDDDASNSSHTVCHCNHLTNFAILMQFTEPIDLGVHDDVLEYLTYIGTSISVLCLVITLLIYLLGKLLKSERIILHSNLAMALLMGQVLFISGVDATSNSSICTAIAVLLHYFFLAAFAWMLVEGIHLYMKSAMVFGRHIKTWIYLLLGWGLPLVIVGVTFAIRYDGYGAEGSGKCWLATEAGLSWAFIGPVLAIILINTVLLILVIRVFMTLKANADKSEVQRIRTGIRAILMLQPLLGISWLFGIFSVNEHTIMFQYLFVICNSLQGVFIFICHCLTNEEVKSIFLKKYKKMASSSIHTSSMGTASSTLTESTQATTDAKYKDADYDITDADYDIRESDYANIDADYDITDADYDIRESDYANIDADYDITDADYAIIDTDYYKTIDADYTGDSYYDIRDSDYDIRDSDYDIRDSDYNAICVYKSQ